MARRNVRWLKLTALVSAATVFQLFPTSCAQLQLYQALAAFNVCSVLNCEAGTFFNFCAPNVLFLDCPNNAVEP